MNQWKYPDVQDWNINFQEVSFLPNGQFSPYYKVKDLKLSGTHYVNFNNLDNATGGGHFFTVV
jgi:hypothetical protein